MLSLLVVRTALPFDLLLLLLLLLLCLHYCTADSHEIQIQSPNYIQVTGQFHSIGILRFDSGTLNWLKTTT